MAYEFENFLVEMGFEKLHKSRRYSDLGVTYRIKSDGMDTIGSMIPIYFPLIFMIFW